MVGPFLLRGRGKRFLRRIQQRGRGGEGTVSRPMADDQGDGWEEKQVRKTSVVILTGGWGESSVELALRAGHQAAAWDLVETFAGLGNVHRIIVAADDPIWARTLGRLPVTVDVDVPGETFHFGRRLAGVIERYGLERVLYTGAGSAPLLQADDWAGILNRLASSDPIVVTNNLHSCDWAGFTRAEEAAALIGPQTKDNGIAWTLVNEGGFLCDAMEPSAGARFDIDTPVDLAIAHRHPGIGCHLRGFLDELGWESAALEGVLKEMRREGGSLMVAGRASPAAWWALQEATRCWVRVFAEERGMRASGRQERGEVRSLLADHLQAVGLERFFNTLAELANGVMLDDRVILCSVGRWPSAVDRFNSDLHRWQKVEDPFLRAFTRAAAEAPVPVVLGGHTVVAGGLMALAEAVSMDCAAVVEGGDA